MQPGKSAHPDNPMHAKCKTSERMIDMTSIKKRFLAGIIAGAVLTTGAVGFYAAHAAERPSGAMMGQAGRHMQEFDSKKAAKHISEQFGVSESEALAALEDGRDMHDIGHAALLAKLSGKSFKDVLAMNPGWREVEKSLGITEDQIRSAMGEMMAKKIASDSGISADTVASLIKEGYHPRDIAVAGRLAKAAGKDVSEVLKMKTINKNWKDIAKDLGVDESLVRPERGQGQGPGMKGRGHGPGFGLGPMGGEEEN